MQANTTDVLGERGGMDQMRRGWQSYWHWKDKPVQERCNARTVLEAAGVKIAKLRSRGRDDPPDCEAFLDDQWSGIEVTELVDQPTLEQSIRARRERDAGKVPELPEVWFVWQRDDLLEAIQSRINKKDTDKVKGGPYQRYVLVMVTAETFLARDYVEGFLKGAQFRAGFFTDAFFGLDYHPANPVAGEGGGNPVFRLRLMPR
jgi:hypothetical protein